MHPTAANGAAAGDAQVVRPTDERRMAQHAGHGVMDSLSQKPRSKRAFTVTVLVCLAFFPFLLTAHWLLGPWTGWPPRVYQVFEKMAEAMFIAGILALSVERFLLSQFAHELGREAVPYLVGAGLPLEVKLRIRDVMGISVVTANRVYSYRFRRPQSGSYHIDVGLTYEVANYTSNPIDFEPMLAFEEHEHSCVSELMLYDLQRSEPLYRLEGTALEAKREKRGDGSVAFKGEKRKIEPAHLVNTYRVQAKYSIETDDRTDLIAFFYPSVGVKIVVEDDGGLEVMAAGPVPATVKTKNLWEYRKAFLPNEHLRLRWGPAETSPSGPSNPALQATAKSGRA